MLSLRALASGRQITCPFCFTTFPARNVAFLCGDAKCPKHSAGATAKKEHQLMVGGHVFSSPPQSWRERIGMKRSARCDACGKDTSKRLCGTCHFELTHDVGLVDER